MSTGGYSVNGGSGENTYGRKSLGQELRVNNVTNPDFTSVPHGNRALATKDMRKSQGKGTTDSQDEGISFGNISRVQNVKRSSLWWSSLYGFYFLWYMIKWC